ncbi:DUF4397 domain-containing protein [candidate division GN15 bacterium]|nr:DUF4397 domain-containing protein [candidate division GN15 bacterium]
MKRLSALFMGLLLIATSAVAGGDKTAGIQIIHNSADPAAETVDIYVNGDLFRDDFAFRTATEFIEVPARTDINVGIAPGTSSSVDDTLANFVLNLRPRTNYVAMATGVLGNGFADNPDGRSTAFTVELREHVRTSARWRAFVDLFAYHGATDAPEIDVRIRGWWFGALVNNLGYGDFSKYRTVLPRAYTLDITPADDPQTIVASFEADLSGLRGGAAVVFASGFLTPGDDNNGPAFGLFAALPDGQVIELPSVGQTAELQVIHNAADPAAEVVDVYVNDSLLLDDFAFRTATPFVEVPANVELTIGIAPPTSASVDDIIASFPVTFELNERYVAIANGVLDPNSFASNPNGESIAFTLFAQDKIRTEAIAHLVKLRAFHGATDAPTVDIRAAKGDGPGRLVFNNLTYGEFSRNRVLRPDQYELVVTPGKDRRTEVARFEADLSGLAGGAAIVFASGFLNPMDNGNGAPFGLFAALPDGQVIELPKIMDEQFARLQVVHNAADPAAEFVDVWVNGDKLIPNFEFRTATPFIDVPAGVELNIGVAPAGSSSQADTLKSFSVTLDPDVSYVVFANGVVGSGFEANPDGRDIAFTLFTKAPAREMGMNGGDNVDFFALHGSTDAPTVDVIARDVATLVDDAAYGDLTDYVSVPAGSYILDVTPGTDNSTIVASFEANLAGLGGGAAAVFASGFLSPDNDNNGPGFGLFAALPNGTVVEFPAYEEPEFAGLQVIHNAADPAAEVVDVWVNGDKLIPNFMFRTATPYVDVPAGVELNIGVAPAGSASQADTLKSFTVTLEADVSYVAVANGVIGDDFTENPDGRDIAFTLFTKADTRQAGMNGSGNVDFVVLHGATDAPTVDVIARDVATIVENAAYGDFTDYISVPADDYILDVTPGDDNNTIVASFSADLSSLGGGAAVVFASGFLTMSDDDEDTDKGETDRSFGIFAALPNGTVVAFPALEGDDEGDALTAMKGGLLPTEYSMAQNYPNPFNPTTIISFALPEAADVQLKIYNVLGQEVTTLVDGRREAGEYQVEWDAGSSPTGVYFYRISAGNFSESKKMVLLK